MTVQVKLKDIIEGLEFQRMKASSYLNTDDWGGGLRHDGGVTSG